MIHDAQAYLSPDSYSRAFAAWYHAALPILGRRSACILTVSEFSKRMLAQHGVAPETKIHVVHNGVDHILRDSADFGVADRLALQKHGYVLALANTQKHKNIGLLIKAFGDPRLSGLRLVLVGGAEAADFTAIGAAPSANVAFAGRVSDAEMRGLMERALCFACPSLTEGFGLPPLEAMLTGCPAIIAPCGALPEVCGDAALRANPHDPAPWREAIESLHVNPDLRRDYSEAGKRQAGQFVWRASAAKLHALLA